MAGLTYEAWGVYCRAFSFTDTRGTIYFTEDFKHYDEIKDQFKADHWGYGINV